MTALLDVNFLVALFSPQHIHHEAAHLWFQANADRGWATCPMTVNGTIRVLSHISAGLADARPQEVARRLRLLCEDPRHTFWPAGISLLDSDRFELQLLQGPRQVTDAYLLGLAVKYEGCLVTFDATIPRKAVKGAAERHLIPL